MSFSDKPVSDKLGETNIQVLVISCPGVLQQKYSAD